MKDFSKASPRPWSTENQRGSNGWVIKAPFTSDDSRNFVEYTLKKDVALPFLIEPWTQFPSRDYKEMVEANADLIVTAVNNFDKMKEALEYLISVTKDYKNYNPRKEESAKQLLESLK